MSRGITDFLTFVLELITVYAFGKLLRSKVTIFRFDSFVNYGFHLLHFFMSREIIISK